MSHTKDVDYECAYGGPCTDLGCEIEICRECTDATDTSGLPHSIPSYPVYWPCAGARAEGSAE